MNSKLLQPILLLIVSAIAAFSIFQNLSATSTITVTHDVITPTATSGSGIGTVRTFNIPITVDGVSEPNHFLVGTLTTWAEAVNDDDELRSANLVFVFGDEQNQIVLGGISLYPPAGATLSVNTQTIRPIIGGSGIYQGASGQVISKNLGDAGWSHVLEVQLP
jgi:hypothetical protein